MRQPARTAAVVAVALALLVATAAAYETHHLDPVPPGTPTANTSTPAATPSEEKKKEKLTTSHIIMYVVADLVLLCGAALYAGLTLGLMGLDSLSLEIIAASGQEPDKTYAAKLLPIRRKGNLLLCTLLLGNVMVNTLIAQITDRLVHGWIGVLVSTVLITLGGEIFPQATMSAHALRVGSSMTPVVRGFLFCFFPICKPLSMFLDATIGNDPGQVYDRNELKTLMLVHAKEHGEESGLNQTDVSLITGAMTLHDKTVAECVTPMEQEYMLEASERLNEATLQSIWSTGHSRIPVYRVTRNNIVGMLFTKDLLAVRADEATRIHDLIRFYPRRMLTIKSTTSLVDALKEFQTGRAHLAMVQQVVTHGSGDPVYSTQGIVTLDDVIEMLLQAVMEDEFDDAIRNETSTAEADDDGGGRDGTIKSAGRILTQAAIVLYKQRNAGGTSDDMNSPMTAALRRHVSMGPASVLRQIRKVTLTQGQETATACFLSESVPVFKAVDLPSIQRLIRDCALVYEVKPVANARGLSMASKSNLWLFRRGVPSNVFTLIVGGAAQAILPSQASAPAAAAASPSTRGPGQALPAGDGGQNAADDDAVYMELPPWSVLGTTVLQSTLAHLQQTGGGAGGAVAAQGTGSVQGRWDQFSPDFDARVVERTTVLQFTAADFGRYCMPSGRRASAAQ